MRNTFLFFILFSSNSFAVEFLETVDSDVFQTTGSIQEITKKAKVCMSRILQNNEVRISDSASGTGFFSGLTSTMDNSKGHSDGVTGGAVLADADIDGGIITANSRIDYSSNLLSHNVKSTVSFQAKEGRFKIGHSNIEYLQKSTGYMHNDGYRKIVKAWGTGWGNAERELQGVTTKIADCILSKSKNDEW